MCKVNITLKFSISESEKEIRKVSKKETAFLDLAHTLLNLTEWHVKFCCCKSFGSRPSTVHFKSWDQSKWSQKLLGVKSLMERSSLLKGNATADFLEWVLDSPFKQIVTLTFLSGTVMLQDSRMLLCNTPSNTMCSFCIYCILYLLYGISYLCVVEVFVDKTICVCLNVCKRKRLNMWLVCVRVHVKYAHIERSKTWKWFWFSRSYCSSSWLLIIMSHDSCLFSII